CVSLRPCPIRRPPTPSLFPYTTLFRSRRIPCRPRDHDGRVAPGPRARPPRRGVRDVAVRPPDVRAPRPPHELRRGVEPRVPGRRSEEHTSELQSRVDLVCRLLLEKKKN